MNNKNVQVVKSLIKDDQDRILLIKRSHSDCYGGTWETPGGGIDGDESVLVAGLREIEEETGIVIKEDNLKFDEMLPLYDSESGSIMDVHMTSTNNPVLLTELDLSLNPDHVDYIWILHSQLKEFMELGNEINEWTLIQLGLLLE